MSALLAEVANFVWGIPLLVFLGTANLILLYYSKLIPLRGFKHAIQLVSGKIRHSDSNSEGQLTHFQALCNALAATIGLGNISGVAIAIYQGGPGAIFWMWIAAILGMNTKFFECTLAVLFRGKDFQGEIQGGPMYFIEYGMGKKFKLLSIAFATFGVVGTLSLFQINQLSHFISYNYEIPNYITGLFFTIAIIYILFGGLKRISSFTSRIVPLMSALYVLLCLIIILLNMDKIPSIFANIFSQALTGKAVGGGVLGYGILHILKTGVKRAAFSNEAGIGTAPMAHGNAKTNEPVSEGYVAMLGPFIDTIVVCTLTAVTILISFNSDLKELNGINLTTYAFTNVLGVSGKHMLGVIILMFSFSTMIGMANYCEKCWNYLFKGRKFFGSKTFIVYYGVSLAIGAIVKMADIVNIIDIAYALMAVPNILGTVYLAGKVKEKLKEYNQKYNL
jgi:AGCS family alanine or glycine:cation symporter